QDGSAQRKERDLLRQVRWSTIAFGKSGQGVTSREEYGGEAAPAGDGCRILGSPGVEELNQLLGCSPPVPLAIATEALEQLGDGFLLLVGRRQCHGVVDAGLVVGRVGLHLGLQFGGIASFGGHAREVKRGARAGDRGGVCLVGG